ncbi:hypothetical protein O9929_24590 [Vibrio lentus]|nr:hypothetical protein [Vibrio lentus]
MVRSRYGHCAGRRRLTWRRFEAAAVVATMPAEPQSQPAKRLRRIEQSAGTYVEQNGGIEFATGLTTSIKGTRQ